MPSPTFAHSALSVGWLTNEASMANRAPSSPTPIPTLLCYGIAVLSVAIALGLDFFVLRHFEAILTPFLFAVAATVWYAGTGPGLLAIVLSVVSLNYFFPRSSFSFSPISYADLIYLTFCIFCALAVGWVSAVRRRAEHELRRARRELEARVVERTANLQRSEGYLAETQKLTRTGSWAWDARSQKVLYCSEEMFRIYGLDPQKDLPTRKNFRQRVHPEDRNRTDARFSRVVNEKVDSFDEYRVLLPDGTVKHVISSGHPILDGNGDLIEFIGTATDVTERKRAEEALRDREAKIRRLVDSNIIGIFITGVEGRVLEANDAFLNLVGHDRNDLVSGRVRWTDLTPPEWRERDKRALAELSSNTIAQPYEKEFFRKDGSRVPVLIGGALFEEGGNEGVAFVLDLTDRKCAEQALRESEYKLRQIIETVPGHLWSASPAFEPTHLNQHLLDYFGRRFEDFKEGGWEAFLHPDDLPETAKAISHAVQTGTYFQVVHRLRRADGEFRWHHARGEPLRNQQGRIIQWYGLSVDIDEAKKNEDRLRRSEAYLAEAQRLSHCGVTAYKCMTVFYGSEEIYRIWGFDPAQGVPSRKAVLQRIHPDDRDRLNAEVELALAEKRRYSTAYRIVLPDGTVKHLESIGQPVFSTNGELVEVVATQIDVTERKRVEETLRESEARLAEARRELQATIDKIPALVASLWPNGERDFVNLTWQRFTGISQEEARGTTQMIPVHPDHRGLGASHWQRCLETGEPFEQEEQLLRVDGQYRWHWVRREPARDENGKVIKWYGIGFDIEDRKRAEERLRVQHTVAQILAEVATIEEATPRILWAMGECLGWDVGVLWRVDREAEALRCVELWHKASIEVPEFERVSRECTFGPGSGLPGRVWSSLEPEYIADVIPDENFPRAPIAEREGLRAAFGFPILLSAEVLGVIEFFSREIKQPDQELLNMLATIGSQIGQFIERKRAEEAFREVQLELAHANRVATVGQLTASITHEVNQPITAAVTYALAARRFLSAEPPNLREVDDALSLIVREGNRAGEVVGRIRALIKKAPARKDAVEINDAIREVIALTRAEATNNSVSVRTQLAEGLPRVQGDRVQLQQILLNLIINAVEAMRDVGEGERELLISSRHEPDGVSVEVRDSGPGFAGADIDRVFEAFYSTKSSGLGLGLSICRSIIEAHNGQLWARPNMPRGAIFRFTVPVDPAAAS
jgi:PAS domain S-box-containing protein